MWGYEDGVDSDKFGRVFVWFVVDRLEESSYMFC